MSRLIFIILLFTSHIEAQENERIIARQGQVSFFSYTSVENIKAENNQVLSIVDLDAENIAVSMLMNSFVFEKALMKEHFNESYIESDVYPKATFEGKIVGFDRSNKGTQTKMIKGTFKMHGVSKQLEIKTKIQRTGDRYTLTGTFETLVKHYNIKIPPLLAGNIADTISINFRFEYSPYEN